MDLRCGWLLFPFRSSPPPPHTPTLFNNHACRLREVLWFVQRLLILAFTSLPASPVFAQPATAPLLAFGLTHLALEALMRRVGVCRAPACPLAIGTLCQPRCCPCFGARGQQLAARALIFSTWRGGGGASPHLLAPPPLMALSLPSPLSLLHPCPSAPAAAPSSPAAQLAGRLRSHPHTHAPAPPGLPGPHAGHT